MQTQNNKLDFTGQNIYIGFDVHLKSWKVTIMTDKLTHKTFFQSPQPKLLYQYLEKNFPGGVYHSAYEAGYCGYWIHNSLKALGINSIVVNPADIPTTDKEKVQKEDARDSRKITKALRNGDFHPATRSLNYYAHALISRHVNVIEVFILISAAISGLLGLITLSKISCTNGATKY